MTLVEFLDEITKGTSPKILSKMIKTLPVEDRKVAGSHFQGIKITKPKEPTQKESTKRYPKGQLIWSCGLGPFKYGMEMYEDGLLIHTEWINKAIFISGQNLKYYEINL